MHAEDQGFITGIGFYCAAMDHRRCAKRSPTDENRLAAYLVDHQLSSAEKTHRIRPGIAVDLDTDDLGGVGPTGLGGINKRWVIDRSNCVSREELAKAVGQSFAGGYRVVGVAGPNAFACRCALWCIGPQKRPTGCGNERCKKEPPEPKKGRFVFGRFG